MSSRYVIPIERMLTGQLSDHAQRLRTVERRKVGVEAFADATSRITDLETRADVVDAFMSLWSEKFSVASATGVQSDATSATFNTWGPGATVDVPTWATSAIITVTITPVKPITSTSNTSIRVALGAAVSAARTVDIANSSALNNDVAFATVTGVTIDPADVGTTAIIKIEAKRNSGVGALRLPLTAYVGYYIEFK